MSLSSECPASLKTPDRDSLIRIISELTTRILNLEEENKELKNLIQAMKDEIRRLKGEKGRPTIKPSLPDNPPAAKKQQRSKKWKKSAKTITRRVRLPISKERLPEDARYKGTRRIVIQDLRIEPDNVEFELERYYSARERKTYESRLPPGYEGSSFGPGIRHLVLALHYQARMPQKLLQTFLCGMGVRISEGEVAFLLVTSALPCSRQRTRRPAELASKNTAISISMTPVPGFREKTAPQSSPTMRVSWLIVPGIIKIGSRPYALCGGPIRFAITSMRKRSLMSKENFPIPPWTQS